MEGKQEKTLKKKTPKINKKGCHSNVIEDRDTAGLKSAQRTLQKEPGVAWSCQTKWALFLSKAHKSYGRKMQENEEGVVAVWGGEGAN